MLKQIDYQGKLEEIAEKFQGRKTEVSKEVNKTVQQIVEDIQKSGDTALFNYAKKFDGYDVNISNLLVTPMERETGLEQIDEDYFRILRRTKSQIEEFHKHQLENSWNIFKENG
ncbi:histidinol dehydrogenase, partial [Staphylococcus hominis]